MIGFRVTDQMLLDNVLTNFQTNEQALQAAEQKVSSGKNISQPSDAPFDAAQAITFRQRLGLNEQLQRNLDSAQGWLNATDSALGSMSDMLQRARELALQGANDTYTADDRQKIGAEVHQLLLAAVDVGNSKFGSQFIFAGTKTTIQPFIHNGSAQSPNISAGAASPVKYLGDAGAVNRQIDQAAQTQINADGTQISGIFATLAQLEYDLNNSGMRVAGSVSGIDPVNGRTTGNPQSVATFSIDGVRIGTNQTLTVNGQAHTIIGFAPNTLISQVISQINTQMAGAVKASVDSNGVLVLQSLNGQPVTVSNVDTVSEDANGNDLTGGTGTPISTGADTSHDLGLSSGMDNAIGSADVFNLDGEMEQLQSVRAQIGAKENRVTSTTTRLSALGVTLNQLDSKIEDVDMAKAVSDLASAQTTFQAALGAAAKVLPPTLLDFLR